LKQMNQNWNDQQEEEIEDFWMFELHFSKIVF
jgi:hypothetical protein